MAQTGAVFGSSTEQRHIWQHRGPVPADVGTTKPPRLIAKTVRICVEAVSLPVLLRSLVGWPRLNSFMITDSSVSGSSPQVRGTTDIDSIKDDMQKAHPRRCGDHRCVYGAIVTLWGSSPQVRGPRAPAKLTTIPIRLIPAGAGTTLRRELLPRRSRAHPRRCGDHAEVTA